MVVTWYPRSRAFQPGAYKRIFLAIVFTVLSSLSQFSMASSVYFSGQLTAEAESDTDLSPFLDQTSLSYLPSLSGRLFDQTPIPLDFNASVLTWLILNDNRTSTDLNLYRLNAQFRTNNSDIRLGLQQLNFGPAFLLRTQRWFDQLDPNDPLRRTTGVNALRYRYFFENNANLWLWTLIGNDQPKGVEQVATSEGRIEWGGRYQWPLLQGEVAITSHMRTTDRAGFTGIDVGKPLSEKRLGFDGRWDPFIGLWFEYMLVDQGLQSTESKNWFQSLTLGSDYTFGLGNGLYTMVEHQIYQANTQALAWEPDQNTSALQINYPLGILDSVSWLMVQNWTSEITTQSASWNRAYDNVSWSINLANTSGRGADILDNKGTEIKLMFVFNH